MMISMLASLNLKQIGIVSDYIARFETSLRLEMVYNEDPLMELFIAGLRQEIQAELEWWRVIGRWRANSLGELEVEEELGLQDESDEEDDPESGEIDEEDRQFGGDNNEEDGVDDEEDDVDDVQINEKNVEMVEEEDCLEILYLGHLDLVRKKEQTGLLEQAHKSIKKNDDKVGIRMFQTATDTATLPQLSPLRFIIIAAATLRRSSLKQSPPPCVTIATAAATLRQPFLKLSEKGSAAVITVGGKGSSLNSSSVDVISNSLAQVRVDSSALERLSSIVANQNPPPVTKFEIPIPKTLTLEETWAFLTVLLNKLLLGSPIRTALPVLISETLNFRTKTLDFVSVDVTEDERVVLEKLSLPSVLCGICAVLDHKSSALSTIIDIVAALSCEASGADVAAFNSIDLGDGFTAKEEIGVAGDLKVLLNGSKLVGKMKSEDIFEIPKINGKLREVVKTVHSTTRIELNSSVKVGISGTAKAVGANLLAFAAGIHKLGESSLCRAKMNLNSISSDSMRSLFEKDCLSGDGLRKAYKLVLDANFEEDYVKFVHEVNLLMGLKVVAVSSGSVCTSASLEPSYVLRALGVDEDMAHISISFGIGRFTTEAEVDRAIELTVKQVEKLREFDSNKQYASKILTILLQCSAAIQKRFRQMNGLDVLLQAVAMYKSTDPKTSDEEEILENLFDSLCCVLLPLENKERFVKAAGVELMIIIMKQKKSASAIRALDFAMTKYPSACERFVGLKTTFTAFMGKIHMSKKNKKDMKAFNWRLNFSWFRKVRKHVERLLRDVYMQILIFLLEIKALDDAFYLEDKVFSKGGSNDRPQMIKGWQISNLLNDSCVQS